MNNTYQYFNSWVYSYYLDRNRQSSQGTFAIDLQVFQNIYNLSSFDYPEIKFGNWTKLLIASTSESGNRIPQYYGLIALQCYAALLMEHDGYESDKMYRSKFVKLTCMSTVSFLDNCFRELYMGQPIQEVIWERAGRDFRSNDIEISLPQKQIVANRYVQFPKSQVVLNREDLKEYKLMFHELKKDSPIISFKDFKNFLIKARSRYKAQIKRFNNIKKDFTPLETTIRDIQIFDFYCSDWEDTFDREKVKKARETQGSCIACLDDDEVELFDFKFNPVSINKLPNSQWLFFKQSDYPNEYWLQSKLEYGREFLICYPNGENILKMGTPLKYAAGDHFFVKVIFDRNNVPPILKWQIIDTYPVQITGVRLDRSNTFLSGLGPFIVALEGTAFDLYDQGKKIIDYPKDGLHAGNYLIRISSFPDLSFTVVNIDFPENIIFSEGTGRSLMNYGLSQSGERMEGSLFHLQDTKGIKNLQKTLTKVYIGNRFPKHYNELKKQIIRYTRYEED